MVAVLITCLLLASIVHESLQQSPSVSSEPVSVSSVSPQTISITEPPDTIANNGSSFPSTSKTSQTDVNSSVTDRTTQTPSFASTAPNAVRFPTNINVEENASISPTSDIDPFKIYPTTMSLASGTDILTAFVATVLDVEESCAANIVFDEGYATKADDVARHLSAERRGFSMQVSRSTDFYLTWLVVDLG